MELRRPLESTTGCNCTLCCRYGVLWANGYEGHEIEVSGSAQVNMRGRAKIGFHFCPKCGFVVCWRTTSAGEDGRRRIAVNLRLADNPDELRSLLVDHFDGLDSFEDLPRDGNA